MSSENSTASDTWESLAEDSLAELQEKLQTARQNVRSVELSVSEITILLAALVDREARQQEEISRLKSTLEAVCNEHVHDVLRSVDGNKTKAAKILGIDRRTIYRRLEG